MKKIIFIFCLILSGFLVNAQSPWQDPALAVAKDAVSVYSLTSDTIAASTTVYLTLDPIYGRKVLVISPYALNVSGTTGVAYTLQAYIGNAWVPLTASNCADMIAASDTTTHLTATAGYWSIHTDANLYRVKCTSDGTTQSSIVKASYMLKEE